jgi:hypothetical protein
MLLLLLLLLLLMMMMMMQKVFLVSQGLKCLDFAVPWKHFALW